MKVKRFKNTVDTPKNYFYILTYLKFCNLLILQFADFPNRHSSDYSSSFLFDHVYSSFDCEKLNVNVVDNDISDHMPDICEIKCEKSKNEYSDLKSF